MTPEDLARWRLAATGLTVPAVTAEETLARIGASQSQDFLPGCWSLAQRTHACTRAAVEMAYDEGRVLRTHTLRPTWHFVSPSDLPTLLAATSPRVHRSNAGMYRREGVDATTMTTARGVFERELSKEHLTRNELGAKLSEAGVKVTGLPLGLVMMYAELEGWVCSGRRKGSQHTYALLPQTGWPDRDEALTSLTTTYLRSRGPATIKDLAGWASLTLTDVRRAVAELGDAVSTLAVGDRTYLRLAEVQPPSMHAPRVDLVQCYDELVMSFFESRDVLSGPSKLPADRRNEPAFYHAVLADGRLVGFWRYQRDGKGVPVEVETRLHAEVDHDLLQAAVDGFLTWAAG